MGTTTMSKLVLITGGSRGLGKNSALALAEKGSDIIITYHSNEAAAQTVVKQIQALGRKSAALPLALDSLDNFPVFVKQLTQLLKNEFSRNDFDYLLNNAGIGIHANFAQTSVEQFDTLMNVHLKGTFFLTQAMLPFLKDGGSIVNISTGLTRFSLPGYCAYAMMKGGLEVMTRYLAQELGARKITVNSLAPGAIETDFGGGAVRDNSDLNALIASKTALGRTGLPDDIGKVIALLLNEDAHWITSQRIEASGGMFL